MYISAGALEARRGCQITWTWGYKSLWAAWCRSWKLNFAPLEEQQASLTSESSLQSSSNYYHHHHYYFEIGSQIAQAGSTCYVDKVDLGLPICLSLLLRCWDYTVSTTTPGSWHLSDSGKLIIFPSGTGKFHFPELNCKPSLYYFQWIFIPIAL